MSATLALAPDAGWGLERRGRRGDPLGVTESEGRKTWTLRGPPDALLRPGGAPRRPFSIVLYWLPGVVLGVVVAACGLWLAIENDELASGWLGVMAGLSAPLGYLLPTKRAMARAALLVCGFCIPVAVLFVVEEGAFGVVMGSFAWTVSVCFGLGGVFAGSTLREIAKSRWYHARFLP